MASGGRDGVTLALLSMPKMSARAILSALPVVILEQSKVTAYRVYTAEALRVITENTAKYFGGGYLKIKYADMINPKPEEKRTGGEIIEIMKQKIAGIGGEAN